MGTPIIIRGYYTCATTFAIYRIKCPCGLMYVRQTSRTVRERIREHKSAIRTKKVEQTVASHFVEKGHGVQQLKYQAPTMRRGGDRTKGLLKKEAMWIIKLETLTPQGLNREYNLQAIFRVYCF
ncbi:hypothetical protein XELAEV_18043680mg [Xenopus laevis]|uniref:GIY-YIG domain-containing protein n=1 Tax=Xenopus laevis TaxID=8355 RepID=A0A974H329_XENLA|nr:hypothetical protein XELAEV_18043680mg [Xenopus laevis]